jgi:hypothetical protein
MNIASVAMIVTLNLAFIEGSCVSGLPLPDTLFYLLARSHYTRAISTFNDRRWQPDTGQRCAPIRCSPLGSQIYGTEPSGLRPALNTCPTKGVE